MMSRLWKIGTNKAMLAAVSLLLAACHHVAQPQVTSTPLEKTHLMTGATMDSDVDTGPVQPPSLEFEWDTSYSNFISPPAEIRKAALESCKARGYDQSYMISMALNKGFARGLFGCRGPN
ncbi:hypothetical protein [Candidatus Puniceispirillum sp.]|uniref:hypothetical protein n=1 Tax=Candidatus Puniceispirillum sp. TaxID=2026719 RepID=UPI003F698ED1